MSELRMKRGTDTIMTSPKREVPKTSPTVITPLGIYSNKMGR